MTSIICGRRRSFRRTSASTARTLCAPLKEQIAKTFLTLDTTPEGKKYPENVDSEKFVKMTGRRLRHHSWKRGSISEGLVRRAPLLRLQDGTQAAPLPDHPSEQSATDRRTRGKAFARRLRGPRDPEGHPASRSMTDDFFAIIGPSGAGQVDADSLREPPRRADQRQSAVPRRGPAGARSDQAARGASQHRHDFSGIHI